MSILISSQTCNFFGQLDALNLIPTVNMESDTTLHNGNECLRFITIILTTAKALFFCHMDACFYIQVA